MNQNTYTGNVVPLLIEADASTFEKGVQQLVDSKMGAELLCYSMVDVLLYWFVSGTRPSLGLTESVLAYLYRHQAILPQSTQYENLLRHLLTQVLGCSLDSFEVTQPTELPVKPDKDDYWLISRYIAAGIGEQMEIPTSTYVEVARENCWFVQSCDYIRACQSLYCLKWLHLQNAHPEFSLLISKYLAQTESFLLEITELYALPHLKWEFTLMTKRWPL